MQYASMHKQLIKTDWSKAISQWGALRRESQFIKAFKKCFAQVIIMKQDSEGKRINQDF